MTLVRDFDARDVRRSMWRHLIPIVGYPMLVWRNRYMVQNFFRRDLMSHFHGSFLGAWWMLMQPLFLFAVYYLVFGLLMGNWKLGQSPDPSFALYLFSGVIAFHALVEPTSQCCSIIVNNGNLVKKVAFPSEVLPIHVGMVSLVMYLVGAIVCLVAGWSFGVLQPGWSLLALPLVLVVQFVMVVGIGLFLANANVFIRDVQQLWRIVAMAWMFVSPVFWMPELMIEKFGDSIVTTLMFRCNPAFPLIQSHRLVLGAEVPGMGELWPNLGIASAWAAGFFVLGYTTFVAMKHKHADIV